MMEKKEKAAKKKGGKSINSRYWAILAGFILVALGIVWFAFRTAVIDRAHWEEKAAHHLRFDSVYVALPARGSILADDGTPLAQTVTFYTIYIDFKTQSLDSTLYVNGKIPRGWAQPTLFLDTLTAYLADNFPEKTQQEYIDLISKGLEKGSRNCVLVPYATVDQWRDFQRLVLNPRKKLFPNYNQGITTYRTDKRLNPYDPMASPIIGKASQLTREMVERNPGLYRDRREWHGTSGIENALDSLLFGEYGTSRKQQRSWGFGKRVETPPTNGYDVRTTIDITMQEMAERHLLQQVEKHHANYGTVIVMEVHTGAIRAMANVERRKDGTYTYHTKRNYATTKVEPGSVVKTLSMLMALEHGNIDPLREFNSAGAIPEIGNYKSIEPHKNPLSARDVIVMSDNRGICRIVYDVYKGRYNDFFYDIRNSGLLETMDIPLPGMLPPSVHPIQFKEPWTYYSFAQAIFGYHNELSPLTTLSVYNAIANDGRLMKPQLVASLERDGVTDTVFAPVCINEHFCSPQNAAILREMLRGVVQEGTARGMKHGRVSIAGKTGTVDAQDEVQVQQPDGTYKTNLVYNRNKRRLAFAGFFPYEDPQYSCIVVIDKPTLHSAGRVSGAVLRAIAEEMYSLNMLDTTATYKTDKGPLAPPAATGDEQQAQRVYSYLKQYPDSASSQRAAKVAQSQVPDSVAREHKGEVTPSVVGMTARDALYTLEQQGLRVNITGKGRVVSQAPAAGAPLTKGQQILLTLN